MADFLKENAVARSLDVSVSTLRRWRAQGKGPIFRKLNGAVRYDPLDVRKFADDRARLCTRSAA